jgi:hypothetical protein
VARSAPPSDDGSPARLIATMLGIVGILLLGSLAWSAVGALASAVGAAGSALAAAANPRPPVTLQPAVAASPTPSDAAAAVPTVPTVATLATATPAAALTVPNAPTAPTAASRAPTLGPTAVVTSIASETPQPQATPTAVAAGRNPWILLPAPEPGATVPAGNLTLEARGRGDAPITAMRIELDGGALPVTLEQRSESTWRGFASTKVGAGGHSVRATVTDANGRTGSFRWTFSVSGGSGP